MDAARESAYCVPRRPARYFHARIVCSARMTGTNSGVSTVDDHNSRIRAAVAGDVDAMTDLLNEHGPEVERALSISREWRSVLEPADVMQVTYLEAFLQITRYDLDRSEPFRAWLQHIAENNLRDAIRGLQRQKRPQPSNRVRGAMGDSATELYEQLGVTTTTPSRHAAHEERLSQLNAVLDALPEDYGRVVRLYDLQALPITEVSTQMGRSNGAVHMLRARAHDRLRQMLGSKSVWFGSSA